MSGRQIRMILVFVAILGWLACLVAPIWPMLAILFAVAGIVLCVLTLREIAVIQIGPFRFGKYEP